jgi:hypothetical protein
MVQLRFLNVFCILLNSKNKDRIYVNHAPGGDIMSSEHATACEQSDAIVTGVGFWAKKQE